MSCQRECKRYVYFEYFLIVNYSVAQLPKGGVVWILLQEAKIKREKEVIQNVMLPQGCHNLISRLTEHSLSNDGEDSVRLSTKTQFTIASTVVKMKFSATEY